MIIDEKLHTPVSLLITFSSGILPRILEPKKDHEYLRLHRNIEKYLYYFESNLFFVGVESFFSRQTNKQTNKQTLECYTHRTFIKLLFLKPGQTHVRPFP